MLRVRTVITVRQSGTGRTQGFSVPFCHKFKVESSWEDMTDTAEVSLPRKISIKFDDGTVKPLFGKNIGGFTSEPFIQRGDQVEVYSGYKWVNPDGSETDKLDLRFSGFVSEIDSKSPFTMKCEDAMWKLKQKAATDKVWKGYTFSSMIEELLDGTGITLSPKTKVSVEFNTGYFVTSGETVAQVLDRIKKDYKLFSYLRGNELRFGYPIYDESEAVENSFAFQRNIISDDLSYKRKEDITLSAVLKTVNTTTGGTTKGGEPKTKRERVQYLITLKNGEFSEKRIPKGQSIPENEGGERRTILYPDGTDVNKMIEAGKSYLEKYYYTGFSGKFVTFGYPFVKHGDNVRITDPLIPERDGLYKVKSVTTTCSDSGLRQEIELDYRITDAQ